MNKIVILMMAVALVSCEKKETTPDVKNGEEPVKEEVKIEKPKEKPEVKEEAGNWVPMDAYGVKFRTPDDWKVSTDGSTATASSPDGTTTAMLIGSDSADFAENALENIKKQVKFEDIALKRSGITTVNGMPGYEVNGTAVLVKEDSKQEIQFLMKSVKVGDKAAALLIFAEAEMYEAKKEEIDGLSNTLNKK